MSVKKPLIEVSQDFDGLEWLNMNFSQESYDTIYDGPRPNGSSRSWYIEETGKLQIPMNMGRWNIFNEHNEMFDPHHLRLQHQPHIIDKHHCHFQYQEDLINQPHIYLITVFNPQYFLLNEDIGFSVVNKEYLNDIRSGRAFIVIFYPYEGYPGTPNNRDFEIVEKWRTKAFLPKKSVHIITGNLIAEEDPVVKNSGLVVHPFCPFEDWNLDMAEEPLVDFKPVDNKYLFLTYNRNPRYPRIFIGSKLIEYDLWDHGKISMGLPEWFNNDNIMREEGISDAIWKKLGHNLPATLDDNLHFNLACNINIKDHEQTFCSIVTETLVDQGTLFLSEKIFKPLQIGHPFFVLGNQGTLRQLRKMGYHTFGEFWDESYDEINDYRLRAEKIAKEIAKLKLKSIDELKDLRNQMHDILLHNKKVHYQALIDNWGYRQTRKPLAVLNILHNLYKKLGNEENFM